MGLQGFGVIWRSLEWFVGVRWVWWGLAGLGGV